MMKDSEPHIYPHSVLLLLVPCLSFAAVENSPDAVVIDNNENPIEEVMVLGQQEKPTLVKTERLLKVAGAGNDPLRAIGALPGVAFGNQNSPAPAVRGSSPSDNLYIIDFLPVGYVFHNDGSSILSDNTLRDFDLDSAAFGAEYNNASGAVIEANSRDPYGTDQGVVDLSLLHAGLFVESGRDTEYGRRGGFLSMRQSLFQYYLKNVLQDEDYQLTTVPEFYDYQGKYQWQTLQDRISLQAIGARDKAGLIFDEDAEEVQIDPELAGGVDFFQQFHTQGLVWDHDYSAAFSHRLGIYSLQGDNRIRLGSHNHIEIQTVDNGLRSEFAYQIHANHLLGWGVHLLQRHLQTRGALTLSPCDEYQPECRISGGDENISIREQFVINSFNVFIRDEWQVSDSITLTPGILGSSDNYTHQQFIEPKWKSRWQIATDWSAHLDYGRYHKMPEDFYEYSPNSGNSDLDQPQSTHYELGLEHQYSDDLLVRLDLYYKDLSKLVVARPDAGFYPDLDDSSYLALPKYSNDASGRAWGAELFINKNLSERWYGWMSLAWARTFRHNSLTDEDFRYAYDQPVILNLVANYEWNDHWNVGMKWRAQSGQLVTPVTGAWYDQEQGAWQPVYGTLNSHRLPMQHSLDLRAERSMERLGMPMELYFEAINAYGSHNIVDYEYTPDYTRRKEVSGLPALLSAGLKIHW
jgi:hypothetical protein